MRRTFVIFTQRANERLVPTGVQAGRQLQRPLSKQSATADKVLFGNNDARPRGRRSWPPSGPPGLANHQHVAEIGRLVVFGVIGGFRGPSQTGGPSDHRLVDPSQKFAGHMKVL